MLQDLMDELQFFPLVFNHDICGFDIYGRLVVRINRIYIEVHQYVVWDLPSITPTRSPKHSWKIVGSFKVDQSRQSLNLATYRRPVTEDKRLEILNN
jgi:hypothetical protein